MLGYQRLTDSPGFGRERREGVEALGRRPAGLEEGPDVGSRSSSMTAVPSPPRTVVTGGASTFDGARTNQRPGGTVTRWSRSSSLRRAISPPSRSLRTGVRQ